MRSLLTALALCTALALPAFAEDAAPMDVAPAPAVEESVPADAAPAAPVEEAAPASDAAPVEEAPAQ